MATLNTRLKLKYDSYTNWSAEANQFILLQGEVAFCYIPDAIDAVHNPPTLMYKVGDGAKTFNQLSWGSALASDVYQWAKQQYAPVASLAGTNGVVVSKTDANAHTVKANLKDYTKSTNAATRAAANAGKTYAVELDKDGHLAVVVPWDAGTNTAHTHTNGVGLIRTGNGGTSGVVDYKVALKDDDRDTNAAVTRPAANASRTYPVIADKDGNLATIVPWTDNNTTSFTISAAATDDDVVVLTGTPGTNGVSYDAKHAKKGPAAGYTSGNTTVAIKEKGKDFTLKLPQVTVDAYGHVTAAADENVVINIPKATKTEVGLGNVENKALDTSVSDSANYVTAGAVKTYVDGAIKAVHQFQYEIKASYDDLGTASAGTMNKIFLVPHSHNSNDSYDEYITIDKGASATPRYIWEKIGNTDIDLSNYVKALTGTTDAGVVTNITKSGSTLTVTSESLATDAPSASGNDISFIDSVSQAKNGKITATKKTVRTATNDVVGVVKGGKTSGKTYGVAVAADGSMTVAVPWTDNDHNDNQKVTAANASGTDVTFGANDTVAIRAGTNVQVVADQAAKKITISATDTKPNNGKLKDGTGIEIFSANASADVSILVIDCGSATAVKYNVE